MATTPVYRIQVDKTSRRRWLQLRLSTLILVMTILCCGLGWLAWERGRIQRRQVDVAFVESLGGRVYFDEETPFLRQVFNRLVGASSPNNLRGVDLRHTLVTDEMLVHVAGLSQFRWLDLAHTKVSDAGLSHIAQIKRLELVNLHGTQVTDAGEHELQKLLPNTRIDRADKRNTSIGPPRIRVVEGEIDLLDLD